VTSFRVYQPARTVCSVCGKGIVVLKRGYDRVVSASGRTPPPADAAAILAAHEAVIQEAGERFFVVAGAELDAIRTDRSYRATHPTFEAYCRERWGFSSSRARQMIRAAKAVTSGNASGKTEREIRRAISSPPEPEREKAESQFLEAIRQLRHNEEYSLDAHAETVARNLAPIAARADPRLVAKTYGKLRAEADKARRDAERLASILTIFDRMEEQEEKAERQRRREEYERTRGEG